MVKSRYEIFEFFIRIICPVFSEKMIVKYIYNHTSVVMVFFVESLGTLPKNWIHFATLKDASIFVQGENLLTFSHQQGLDPEQPISGVVSYRYPAMKTFSFGINVTL